MAELLDCTRPEAWASWLDDELDRADASNIADRLRTRFDRLRAFHAARPTEPASYDRLGIRPLSRSAWNALVTECFLAHAPDPHLAAAIEQARDVQFELIADGHIHFCCDERLLEERDGYHLLYGSLSLLAVAIRIDKEFGTSFRDALRRRGEPVVFVCDVPLRLITDDELARLATALAEALAALRTTGALPSPFGFHFSIPCALPPEAVVARRRPRRVVDWVYGRHIEEAA